MLRHHRLLELYLAEALGVPWDRVHDEAEVLEHVLSEELEELIAAKLGNPTRRPARRPDPRRATEIDEEPDASRLAVARAGRSAGVFVRVSDSDPEMLRYLSERGHRARATRSRSSTSSRSAARSSSRFGDDVHVLGGDARRARCASRSAS